MDQVEEKLGHQPTRSQPLARGEMAPPSPRRSSTVGAQCDRTESSDSLRVNSLESFQSHSRLHFIGQWVTRAHDILKNDVFVAAPHFNHGVITQRTVAHIDMDCFFCNVALAKPEFEHLRDQPVAVFSGGRNSDISSCNYVARQYGVKAGMWGASAHEKCPQLKALPYDFAAVERINRVLYNLLFELCPVGACINLEVLSVDEVLVALDTSDLGVVEGYVGHVRREIRERTKCTASAGIACTISAARMATALAKPDGQRAVPQSTTAEFVAARPVTELHGVGRQMHKKLMALMKGADPFEQRDDGHRPLRGRNVKQPRGTHGNTGAPAAQSTETIVHPDQPRVAAQQTATYTNHEASAVPSELKCGDLMELPKRVLQDALGRKLGDSVFNLLRGVDGRVVKRTGTEDGKLPLSVGCTMNYALRVHTVLQLTEVVRDIVADVCGKLDRHELAASNLRLSVLVRHPGAPFFPPKTYGCGRCVEHVFQVKLPCGEWHVNKLLDVLMVKVKPAIDSSPTLKLEHARAVLEPGTTREDINAALRATAIAVINAPENTTVDDLAPKVEHANIADGPPEPTSDESLIALWDVRGLGLIASQLSSRKAIEAAAREQAKQGRHRLQQVSLTAAMRTAVERRSSSAATVVCVDDDRATTPSGRAASDDVVVLRAGGPKARHSAMHIVEVASQRSVNVLSADDDAVVVISVDDDTPARAVSPLSQLLVLDHTPGSIAVADEPGDRILQHAVFLATDVVTVMPGEFPRAMREWCDRAAADGSGAGWKPSAALALAERAVQLPVAPDVRACLVAWGVVAHGCIAHGDYHAAQSVWRRFVAPAASRTALRAAEAAVRRSFAERWPASVATTVFGTADPVLVLGP